MKTNSTNQDYTALQLLNVGIPLVRRVVVQAIQHLRIAAGASLKSLSQEHSEKRSILADEYAQQWFSTELKKKKFYSDIRVVGEESLDEDGDQAVPLRDETRFCALIDPIDGTDLYERGLGNWCTAVTFFRPSSPAGDQIKVAIVGCPDGTVYFARNDVEGAFVTERGVNEARPLRGASSVTSLENASICFYGQKWTNFVLASKLPIWKILNLAEHELKKTRPKASLPMRVYNLAGIPMMVRMVDKLTRRSRGIDLIFETKGQHPHDVVSGAFIAIRGGAKMYDIESNQMSSSDLEKTLMWPDSARIQYVLAATSELAKDFLQRGLTKVANKNIISGRVKISAVKKNQQNSQ